MALNKIAIASIINVISYYKSYCKYWHLSKWTYEKVSKIPQYLIATWLYNWKPLLIVSWRDTSLHQAYIIALNCIKYWTLWYVSVSTGLHVELFSSDLIWNVSLKTRNSSYNEHESQRQLFPDSSEGPGWSSWLVERNTMYQDSSWHHFKLL